MTQGKWCECGKKIYRTWGHARNDAKKVTHKNKGIRAHVYYSRQCNAIHVGKRKSGQRTHRT